MEISCCDTMLMVFNSEKKETRITLLGVGEPGDKLKFTCPKCEKVLILAVDHTLTDAILRRSASV